jgi:hypothetical protein
MSEKKRRLGDEGGASENILRGVEVGWCINQRTVHTSSPFSSVTWLGKRIADPRAVHSMSVADSIHVDVPFT